MLANAGSSSILWPPTWTSPTPKAVSITSATATTGDQISISIAADLTAPLTVLLWATSPNADPTLINVAANKFIGAYTFPSGDKSNSPSGDFGPAYVTAFATLAGNLGDTLVIWCFVVDQGNVRYVGGVPVIIQEVSLLANSLYYPLNETFSQRRSIIEPADLTPGETLSTTTGVIDAAVVFPRATHGYLTAAEAPGASAEEGGFTIALWLKMNDVVDNQTIAVFGTGLALPNYQWKIAYIVPAQTLRFSWTSGIGDNWVDLSANPITVTNQWHHVAWTLDIPTAASFGYFDGVLDNSPGLTEQPQPMTGPLSIGNLPLALNALNGAMCELAIWQRALSAAEITALYNSGAGLRFPYA